MKIKVILNLSLVLLMLGIMSTRAFAIIAPPTTTYPADTQKFLLLDIDLQWNSVPLASYYALQVSTDITFTDPEDQVVNLAKVEDTQFDLEGLRYGQVYFWRLRSVIAEDGIYQESAWSTPVSFTTIPAIKIVGQMEVCNDIDNIKTYTVDDIPNVDYAWSVVGGTILDDGDADDNSVDIQWTTSSGSGTITVVRTSDDWDEFSDEGSTTVVVDAIKTLTISTETDTYFDGKYCPNERIKFTATLSDLTYGVADLEEYYWEFENPDAPGGIVKVPDVLSTIYTWEYPGTYHVKFFARTIAANCANYTKEFDVIVVNTCPVTALLDVPESICQGTAVAELRTYVFGGTGGDYTYKWTPAASFMNSTVKDGLYKETTRSKYLDFYATDENGEVGHLNFKVLLRPRPVPSIVPVMTVPVSVNNLSFTDGDANGDYVLLKNYGCDPAVNGCLGWTWEWLDKNYNPTIDPDNVNLDFGINTFYLTVTNDLGCDSKLYRGVIYRARSKEIMEHEYTLGNNASAVMFAYPNPTVNYLNVFAEFEKEANITCSIISLDGKILKTFNTFGKIYDSKLDVNDLPTGAYILSVETNDDAVVWKFNKN